MPDKRSSSRQKSLLRGIVYFDGNPNATACVVRDMSGTGARVTFNEPPIATGDHLELQIPNKALRYRARVVWRSKHEMGLAFVDAAAADASPQALAERIARLEAEIQALKDIVSALQPQRAVSA
jgi:hypothetical protein